ncbi:DEAD/DEAH box helicase [Sutcliffiella rhizosphaerae]|uniref:ATP-dependent RNA helicase YfmL n=1 Tax=Sutcliffiella rhizosphaerae TaxID=2880967 RepID=A0ABN8AFQ6_9BACI|nr:DEAD/DEAH box helicase [Sutcliffiella rhizosphaerae]CAG9622952.1 putative ATP-dependent RNA helicase YfmL [Sutcliffiella rhizosphaerae]
MSKPFIDTMQPFLKEIWEKSNFDAATAVQEQAIPLILEGKDVLVESPTGTGKTLAYLLPIIERIDTKKQHPQTVIVAPSKELAMQILSEIQKWTDGSDITGASFIGGANIKRQTEKLKKRPHILVGTPGRLQELIQMKKIKMHEVTTIVLDEADQLLVPEHKKTIENIIKSSMQDRQILLFSATLKKETETQAVDLLKEPTIVTISRDELPPAKVKHIYTVIKDHRDKPNVLANLLREPGIKALAFVRDIGNLAVLTEKLIYKQLNVGLLHSDSSKQERENALKNFRKDEYPVLLATDVAARGLDIKELSHVIHYDFPEEIEGYVHRSGRTGRQGAEGTVISIVTEREERKLKQIAKELGIKLEKKVVFSGKLMEEEDLKARKSGGRLITSGKKKAVNSNGKKKNHRTVGNGKKI